jgi:hypothetical protein
MVGHGLNAQGEMTHMVRRAWKFKRAALAIAIALTVLSHSALVSHCFADECQCGGGCVERCPAALPVLETLCGQSLFWHDPCGNGYRDREYDCYFHESTPPRWYASAEFVPLFRDQSGSQPFQALATFDDTTATWNRQSVLSTNDFDADFEPGFRVLLGRALGDWYRLEGSYLGSYSWGDSAAIRYVPVVPPTQFAPGEPATFDPGIPASYDPGTPASFDPGTPATFDPGTPPSFTLIPPSFDPGTPASFDPGTPPSFDPGTPASFDAGTPASFDPGTPATLYEPGSGLVSPFSNFGDPTGPSGLGPVADEDFFPSEDYDYNNSARIRFTSRMDDVQLNLRRRVRVVPDRQVRAETSCLVGLRYMNIAESFGYVAESPLAGRGTQWRNVHTNNDMFGVQIGALAQFLVVDQGWIDFEVKGVMFFNEASNRIESNFLFDPYPADAQRTSFMGDLALNFNYQFAPSWTFRLGYNAMWLTGVALASENFFVDVNTPVTSPNPIDHSGRIVYHGPTIGLVWAR